MNFHKTIAAVFGIGYLPKGGGSVAAAVYCLIWILIPSPPSGLEILWLVLVLILGTWSAGKVEKIWGVDSGKVVVDEVAGMMISLLFIPVEIKYVVFAFIVFRFFDILKPLGIRKLEKLPSGWGVMADDVLSGVYTWALLKTCMVMKLL
ncbi:MAG: phosphatidylglycerophosphatase A [Ginsengibacter sp.]